MNATPIEYVDFTWNPVTGCLRGCAYCYARRLAQGRLRTRYMGGQGLAGYPSDPFAPRFWPERMDGPSHAKKSKAVFVSDMGDLFGPGVPDSTIDKVIQVTKDNPQHDYLFLTKEPGRLKDHTFGPTAWVGATATNEEQLRAAVEGFRHRPEVRKFISFEPLLRAMPTSWLEAAAMQADWFIIGAQTKPTIMPDTSWVLDIHAIADRHGIPVFHKDNLGVLRERVEWPSGYRKGARDAAGT